MILNFEIQVTVRLLQMYAFHPAAPYRHKHVVLWNIQGSKTLQIVSHFTVCVAPAYKTSLNKRLKSIQVVCMPMSSCMLASTAHKLEEVSCRPQSCWLNKMWSAIVTWHCDNQHQHLMRLHGILYNAKAESMQNPFHALSCKRLLHQLCMPDTAYAWHD